MIITGLFCGCASPKPDRLPTIAGQTVPNENVVLDFTKRYDIVCRDGQTTRTYNGCRILGYTGETVRDAEGAVSRSYSKHFARWLVVELTDGRRVVLSPGSVAFLEETRM